MPSAQDCAERLREQAYKTLLPQIRDLEQELQSISTSLSTGIQQIGRKLESLSRIELPTTELVLTEILGDVTREKDLQTSAIALFARSLNQKETQEEILNLLLDFTRKQFPQTALFVTRGDRFVGWSSRGFSEDLASSISSSSFLRSQAPKFLEVLESGNLAVGSGFPEEDPLHFLQGEDQKSYCLLPLNVLQRPVAVLLAESVSPTETGTDAISVFVQLAALRLENIALKILLELTAAKAESGAPVQQELTAAIPAKPAPQPYPEVAEEPPAHEFAPEPAPAMPIVQWAATQAPAAEPIQVPVSAFEAESFQIPAPPEHAAPFMAEEKEEQPVEIPSPPIEIPEALKQIEIPEAAQTVEIPEALQAVEIPEAIKTVDIPKAAEVVEIPEPVKPVEIPEPAKIVEIPEAAPVVEMHEPAKAVEIPEAAKPVEIPEPAKAAEIPKAPETIRQRLQEIRRVPEEEKLHSDAKRFARLLVSEIKLYNERHVVEGRTNRDLYLRLKRDIDRSREMYEKRVSPAVSRKIDYFHDEIIRILGDNDPSTLGSDYPGPRVES